MDKTPVQAAARKEADRQTLRLQRELRDRVLDAVTRRHVSYEDLAARLDLLPSGVEILLERPVWSLEVGVRLAHAVGLDVALTTQDRRRI